MHTKTGLLLLALSFGVAAPVIAVERTASPESSETQTRACQTLYVQKLRAARDALTRHEAAQAADYLVGAKEVLSECMKNVRAPIGPQDPRGSTVHMLSEIHTMVHARRDS